MLLDNTPDYLFALGGAALAGATVVGANHTRKGEHLARDLVHTDVAALVTEPRHLGDVEAIVDHLPFGPERIVVSHRYEELSDGSPAGPLTDGIDLDVALAGVPADDPGLDPDVATPWALIFTSGTSSAPKAVICSQRRLLQTGARMATMLAIGPDDVGYVCMPLFHSTR